MEARTASPKNPIVLVPPLYTKCVSTLLHGAGGARGLTSAVAKARCAASYREYEGKIMGRLLSAAWALVGGEEHGIVLSDEEVRKKARVAWPSATQLRSIMALTGDNVSDVLFNIRYQMLVERLRAVAVKNVPAATTGVLERYYEAHKASFTTPEERDIAIVRITTVKGAERAKQELEKGVSFVNVLKEAGPQPLYLQIPKGLLSHLKPDVLRESTLNDAIFNAKLRAVSGPVRINKFPGYHARFHRNPNDINNIDGYYIFIVQAIHKQATQPFAKAKSQLRTEVPAKLQAAALTAFIARWRATLRAETDCMPGFVVRKCRQYVPVKGEAPEDPTTID
jgi:hypothetical protein